MTARATGELNMPAQSSGAYGGAARGRLLRT